MNEVEKVISDFSDEWVNGPERRAKAERRAEYAAALAGASRKFDTPRRKRPRPCNGVVESDRELARRMNWLRNKVAEAA